MPEGKSMLDPVKPEDSYSAKTHLHQPVPEMATVAATALPADDSVDGASDAASSSSCTLNNFPCKN